MPLALPKAARNTGSGGTTSGIRVETPTINTYALMDFVTGDGVLASMFATGSTFIGGGGIGGKEFGLVTQLAGSNVHFAANNAIKYSTGGQAVINERMRISNLGNVGIGTNAATDLFQVNQTTVGEGTVVITGTTTCTGTGTKFTDTFKIGDSITITTTGLTATVSAITSDTLMTISATTNTTASAYTLTGGNRFSVMGNGNVGIGTTAPSKMLSVGANLFQADSAGIQWNNNAQTTYSGSTSGTAVWSQPFKGSAYKKFIINFAALNDAGGTITFPTAFSKTPYVYGDATAVAVSSASTTTFTIAASVAITGNVFVEGY